MAASQAEKSIYVLKLLGGSGEQVLNNIREWMHPGCEPKPKLLTSMQMAVTRLTQSCMEKDDQIAKLHKQIESLNEDYQESVQGLQYQVDQQYLAIKQLREENEQLQAKINPDTRTTACQTMGSSTADVAVQAATLHQSVGTNTDALVSSPPSIPPQNTKTPVATADIETQTQESPPELPPASPEYPSTPSENATLSFDLRILNTKYSRAVGAKVELEEQIGLLEQTISSLGDENNQLNQQAVKYKARASEATEKYNQLRKTIDLLVKEKTSASSKVRSRSAMAYAKKLAETVAALSTPAGPDGDKHGSVGEGSDTVVRPCLHPLRLATEATELARDQGAPAKGLSEQVSANPTDSKQAARTPVVHQLPITGDPTHTAATATAAGAEGVLGLANKAAFARPGTLPISIPALSLPVAKVHIAPARSSARKRGSVSSRCEKRQQQQQQQQGSSKGGASTASTPREFVFDVNLGQTSTAGPEKGTPDMFLTPGSARSAHA